MTRFEITQRQASDGSDLRFVFDPSARAIEIEIARPDGVLVFVDVARGDLFDDLVEIRTAA